jgi:predicted tellurium resistance membrane protein TerC
LTLLASEIVLGIDNIVFISIIVDKVPEERQALTKRQPSAPGPDGLE